MLEASEWRRGPDAGGGEELLSFNPGDLAYRVWCGVRVLKAFIIIAIAQVIQPQRPPLPLLHSRVPC